MAERFGIENRVRISGVGERVSNQAANSQRRVRRPADVRDRVGQSILIIRSCVIGVEPAEAERIIQLLDFSFALECFAKGSVRTAFGAEHESRSTVATRGEN